MKQKMMRRRSRHQWFGIEIWVLYSIIWGIFWCNDDHLHRKFHWDSSKWIIKPSVKGSIFVPNVTSGIDVNFMTYGQTGYKRDIDEYKEDNNMSKTEFMTIYVVGIINKFLARQQVRQSIPLKQNVASE